jgi:ribonuclease D
MNGLAIGSFQESPGLLWVDTPEALAQVCRKAAAEKLVAVDTEADSFHSYFPKVCLIQISFGQQHALLDSLRLAPPKLAPLAELLADPKVGKIFHGADYDLRMLHKDLGVRVRGLFDTQAAAQVLGEKQTSLAALVAKELGVHLDKGQQRANWALRPLPPEMLAYAVDDTRFLPLLLQRLVQRLEEMGRKSWWEEECRALEEVVYEPPTPDPWAFLRIKGARSLPPEVLGRLAACWQLREEIAQSLDVPPFRVLSSELLVRLASDPPTSVEGLLGLPGLPFRLVRRWGKKLLDALHQASPLVPPEKGQKPRDPHKERMVDRLRRVRDELAQELNLDPGFLAPRWALEAVVESQPKSPEEWYACLQRHWRVEVLAQKLGQAMQEG